MTDLNAKIRDLVEGFVQELSTLVRQSAVERAVDALRGTVPAPSGSAKPRGAAKKALAKSTPNSKVRKGAKRSPKQIEKTVQSVLGHIKAQENARAEDIRKVLGLSRIQTADALRRLLAKKAIKSKGERRATTYSAV